MTPKPSADIRERNGGRAARVIWNGNRWISRRSRPGFTVLWSTWKSHVKGHARASGCDICSHAKRMLASHAGPFGPKPPALPPTAFAEAA